MNHARSRNQAARGAFMPVQNPSRCLKPVNAVGEGKARAG